MAKKETPIVDPATAERVRRRIGRTGVRALDLLRRELDRYGLRETGSGVKWKNLPEAWVRKYKGVADQLRRDYRLDGESLAPPAPAAEAATPPKPTDPLDGLRLVDGDAA